MPEPEGPSFNFEYQRISKGEVRVVVEGFEVMRVFFFSQSLHKALFEKLQFSEPWISIPDPAVRKAVFEGLRQRFRDQGFTVNDNVTDEFLSQFLGPALRNMEHHFIDASARSAVQRIENKLQIVTKLLWDKLLQVAGLSGANALRDMLDVPDQKYKAHEMKDAIFHDEWELLKPVIGVTHGGARKPRKSKFTWDADKARQFYKAVQALPRISKKLPWEYAEEQLRANDYTADMITWLQSHPAFAKSPEALLKEAASIWRTYEEQGQNIPAKHKPLAFAFRHACHKLGYPEKAYNTLRTRYYEGKKADGATS
jgi:hypothetical protein